MIRLSDRLRQWSARLAAAGVDSPRVDAELLAAHVLRLPRGRLLLVDALTSDQVDRIDAMVRQREQRVPLQHLIGTAGFLGLDLAVGPGVFVPRPETELLAAWGIDAVADLPDPVVVDLCSGTGALALAVSVARPQAQVYAVELSEQALPWLRRNVDGTGVRVVHGDATAPGVLAELDGAVDLVLSNPPYVPDTVAVPPEVAEHDPALAVFGGPDGLAVIRPLVTRAAALLHPGGLFGIEHDDTHAEAIAALLEPWFEQAVTRADLAGRPRFSTAMRRRSR